MFKRSRQARHTPALPNKTLRVRVRVRVHVCGCGWLFSVMHSVRTLHSRAHTHMCAHTYVRTHTLTRLHMVQEERASRQHIQYVVKRYRLQRFEDDYNGVSLLGMY